ncbi:MAG: CD225/dispanin family protein [Opitutaceae bacterium]|nr:CD225/dispanin family protein [Verrucomicrobiales bacterium]
MSDSEIRCKLASGEILASDLVWREGMGDWKPAATVSDLAMASAVRSATSEVPPAPGSSPVSPYSTPSTISPPIPPGREIPNYLWQSIVVTLFCCLPFGIPAIVYAAQVDTLKAQGNLVGASSASASAKTWCLISAGIALGLVGLWLIVVILAAASTR